MTCLVFYTLKIIWMSVFVLFYGVFYGVWITHAWCYMMRDSLYGRVEKPISACGKGFVRMWYGLFRSVGKAFSRVGNGRMRWRFFQYAGIQRFMLSLQNRRVMWRVFEYADMKCLISSLQNSRIRWRGESCWSVRDSQRVDVILFFSQSLQYGADMWRLSI